MSVAASTSAKSRERPRIGSVAYLNALPLTYGISFPVALRTPAELARMLRANELDAALVSVTEVLRSRDYVVLDGVAVGSAGEVKSVFLAHRPPLAQVREIACDLASLTSVALLRVLLAQRGLAPALVPLRAYGDAAAAEAVLLIGDPALEFLRRPHEHRIWDLGSAWDEATGLPFVYAVWAIRPAAATDDLCSRLIRAKRRGVAALDDVIRGRSDFDPVFARDYLTRNIRFDLGMPEKAGLTRFAAMLRPVEGSPLWEPRYVCAALDRG